MNGVPWRLVYDVMVVHGAVGDGGVYTLTCDTVGGGAWHRRGWWCIYIDWS